MSEIRLKDIWDLRGELDQAVLSQEYEKITDIKNKYITMVKRMHPRNMLFYNFREKSMSLDSDRASVSLNRLLIFENIYAYEKKYIQGQGYSLKLKKPYYKTSDCYAVNFWVLRAVFDKFLSFDPANKSQEQIKQNMILAESLIDKIRLCKLSAIHEWEKEELAPIESEIVKAYITFCNNNDLTLLNSALANEFVNDQESTEHLKFDENPFALPLEFYF